MGRGRGQSQVFGGEEVEAEEVACGVDFSLGDWPRWLLVTLSFLCCTTSGRRQTQNCFVSR